ncbi:MAG: hypothetical protein KGK03_01375 [Candidatus Omnitrophica bacterium]|nr:hypothetical protein [Candidatus Omnitrophota bacterium]
MNNKGQSILAEHVMVFFVVIAAITAISVLVQRGLQARIHEARNFAVDSVINACDINCLKATGRIPHEYEPYYMVTTANIQTNEAQAEGTTTGNPQALGVKYLTSENTSTQIGSNSIQLPAICSGPYPPICCHDGTGCRSCSPISGHSCGPDTCGNANGSGSCNPDGPLGDPHSGTCDTSTWQCDPCHCQVYTESTLEGMCPATYTADCGADSCGHADACGSCGSYTWPYDGKTYTTFCSMGRCWFVNPYDPGHGWNCANCAHPCF